MKKLLFCLLLAGCGSTDVSLPPPPTNTGHGFKMIVFESKTHLTPEATSNISDVYLLDRIANNITLIKPPLLGTPPIQGMSKSPYMTPDFKYVVFSSTYGGALAGDTVDYPNIWRWERAANSYSLVEADSSSNPVSHPNGWWSDYPNTTNDGRYVIFQSGSPGLVTGDNNNSNDIFLKDMVTYAITRISVGPNGVEGTCTPEPGSPSCQPESINPKISGDGGVITFSSRCDNFVPNDTNFSTDVFVIDKSTDVATFSRVSTQNGTDLEVRSHAFVTGLSSDGKQVLFWSLSNSPQADYKAFNSSNPDWLQGGYQVFVKDLSTRRIERISVNNDQKPALYGYNLDAKFAPNSNLVAFISNSPTLLPATGARELGFKVYLRDRLNKTTTEMSKSKDGTVLAKGDCSGIQISLDSTQVFFSCWDGATSKHYIRDIPNGGLIQVR